MNQTSRTGRTRTTCLFCKHPLPRFQPRGRKRYYCSHTCKLKAYRARKKAVLPKKRIKRPASPGEQATCLVCERPLRQAQPKRR